MEVGWALAAVDEVRDLDLDIGVVVVSELAMSMYTRVNPLVSPTIILTRRCTSAAAFIALTTATPFVLHAVSARVTRVNHALVYLDDTGRCRRSSSRQRWEVQPHDPSSWRSSSLRAKGV